MVLNNALYCCFTQVAVDAAAYPTQQSCVAQTPQGPVRAHPSSVNRFLAANGFLVYHEKVLLSSFDRSRSISMYM